VYSDVLCQSPQTEMTQTSCCQRCHSCCGFAPHYAWPLCHWIEMRFNSGLFQHTAGCHSLRLQLLNGLLHCSIAADVAHAPQRPFFNQRVGVVDLAKHPRLCSDCKRLRWAAF
jgi:hypothetical protein